MKDTARSTRKSARKAASPDTYVRSNHGVVPENLRKLDTSQNGDVDRLVLEHSHIEKTFVTLRIDARTVIRVPASKCTEAHRLAWMKRHGYPIPGEEPKKKKPGTRPEFVKDIPEDELRRLLAQGMPLPDIARELGCSRALVYSRARKLNKEA